MAQVSFDIEFEIKGHKKLQKTMKNVEEYYIRDISGRKNREIMEKMRQKLQLMYPGAKITKRSSGGNMNFKIENIGQLNEVSVNKLALEMADAMSRFQGETFLKAEE